MAISLSGLLLNIWEDLGFVHVPAGMAMFICSFLDTKIRGAQIKTDKFNSPLQWVR